MSGSYVNNDSRSDALNSAAAHDKGLYDPNTHDNQIVALYETMAEANKARDLLVHAGVDSNSIQVTDKSTDVMAGGVDYEAGNQGMWGAIKSLFVPDDEAHAYNHAIGKGHAMVVVSAAARDSADADSGPGVLFSSGLIAGGAIMGVVLAGLAARRLDEGLNLTRALGSLAANNVVAVIGYVALLAVPLYLIGRRGQRSGT